MAVPPSNEGRETSDQTRATTNTSTANPNRGTENKSTTASDVLKQEPEYASKPGPLMRMLQAVDAATKETVDTLLVCDQSLNRQISTLYNQVHFGSTATERRVDSWAGVLRELGTYDSIKTLTFLLHSIPGIFLFHLNQRGETSDFNSLPDAGKKFEQLKRKPRIGTLDLQGCNLGADLDAIVSFGLSLNADVAIATNQYHEFALKTFRVAKGEDKVLEEQFRVFNGYLVGPSLRGWVGLARTQDVTVTLLLEWFVGSAQDHRMNLPVDEKYRLEHFHTVESLQPERIKSEEELARLKTALSDRIPRRITIELSAFRKRRADGR